MKDSRVLWTAEDAGFNSKKPQSTTKHEKHGLPVKLVNKIKELLGSQITCSRLELTEIMKAEVV